MKRNRGIPWWIWPVLVLAILFFITVTSQGQEATPGEQAQPDPFFPPGVEGTLTAEQQVAFERLQSQSRIQPYVRVEHGITRFANMAVSIPDSSANTAADKASIFLEEYSDLYDLDDPSRNLQVVAEDGDPQGYKHVSFIQSLYGIPVYGAMIKVHSSPSGEIQSSSGAYVPGVVPPSRVAINDEEAREIIRQTTLLTDVTFISPTTLMYFDESIFGSNKSDPQLIWVIRLTYAQSVSEWFIFVDAVDGEIVRQKSPLRLVTREVWDANEQIYQDYYNQGPPDTFWSSSTKVIDEQESDKPCLPNRKCIKDATDFYNYSGKYGEFLEDLDRNSLDGDGLTLKAYVNIDQFDVIEYPSLCTMRGANAMWSDDYEATFYSAGYAGAEDIVAHELTHGLIHYAVKNLNTPEDPGLIYEDEPGALNESYADVFALLLDTDEWKIGDDLGLDNPCKAVRNVKNPSSCYPNLKPFPDNYEYYEPLPDGEKPNLCNRYGDVHLYSSIPSKAAHLLIEGGDGTKPNQNIAVSRIGREKLAEIYYLTITKYLHSASKFRDARDGTISACINLMGTDGIIDDDCLQVANAFAAVGIGDPFGTISNVPPDVVSAASDTVLVFDTSGSMQEEDTSGLTKLQAAQLAGSNITNIIAAENAAQSDVENRVGVVDFNVMAKVDADLSADVSKASEALRGFEADGGTGMPDGLRLTIDMLNNQVEQDDNVIIVLLSDGLPNIPLGGSSVRDDALTRKQVLDLASEAGQQGYCVYTVGFGIPRGSGSVSGEDSINEEFLRQVAQNSGCGTYYNAQNATELANVYVDLRHTATGDVQLNQSGDIAQGQTIDIGQVPVARNQSLMLFTLNWPGSKLDPMVVDPRGRSVDANYRGASITTQSSIATVIVNEPRAGPWQVGANGADVPEGTTTYHAVVSTRAALGIPLSMMPLWLMLGGLGVVGGAIWMSSRRSTGWYLVVKEKEGESYQVKVGRKGVWIGRDPKCEIHLSDPAVSRRHAWIGPSPRGKGELFVRDEDSQMGTKRNGEKVQQAGLTEKDEITVGSTRILPKRGKTA